MKVIVPRIFKCNFKVETKKTVLKHEKVFHSHPNCNLPLQARINKQSELLKIRTRALLKPVGLSLRANRAERDPGSSQSLEHQPTAKSGLILFFILKVFCQILHQIMS